MKTSFLVTLLAVSWIFLPSTYSHKGGERVSQYRPLPKVEPLDDERSVTYRRRYGWTYLHGTRGGYEAYYERQAW